MSVATAQERKTKEAELSTVGNESVGREELEPRVTIFWGVGGANSNPFQ